jgi:hypothetical protein
MAASTGLYAAPPALQVTEVIADLYCIRLKTHPILLVLLLAVSRVYTPHICSSRACTVLLTSAGD